MAVRPLPRQANERDTLIAFLDYFRAVLVDKCADLTHEQLHTAVAPSSLTLGQLLHHMALVEDSWFADRFAGGPEPEPWASAPWQDDYDWELTVASTLTHAEISKRYDDALARSRAVVDAQPDLDTLSTANRGDGDVAHNLRWILVHMIEEYARHLGHADFIRESIDGATGDFRDDT